MTLTFLVDMMTPCDHWTQIYSDPLKATLYVAWLPRYCVKCLAKHIPTANARNLNFGFYGEIQTNRLKCIMEDENRGNGESHHQILTLMNSDLSFWAKVHQI